MAVVEEKYIGTIEVKRRKPRIATHAMSDQIAEEDKLGFRDYVDAFVGLITSPDTKPPLTIGIYGPWGAGKSTLMDMIKDKLEPQGAKKQKWFRSRKKESSSKVPELQTIWFDAWLYSKEKKLWTVFMKKIFEKIEKKITLKNKLKFFCSYPRRKVKIKRASLLIVPISAIIGGFYYLPTLTLIAESAFVGGLIGLAALGWRFFDVIKKPITVEMLSLIEKKDEKEEVGLMPKIREDIGFLNKFFEENKRNTKIIIFVDNLDRCPDDTSVDVLESVSLLLNINCFIVILGVEEEILHKAIKLRYKELLDKSSTAETTSEIDFLDKIVQIPFYIPQDTDLKEYVLSLIGPKKDKTGEEDRNIKPEPTIPKPLEDSEDEQKWFVEWQKYLPKNPRKVKRLINIYRLVKILAGNKKGVEFIKEPGNQSKLIKWLIICEQCSYFTKEINLNSEAKMDTFLPSGLTSIIEKYKGVIKYQEDIKTLEEFINIEPPLGVKDIENFNKFTANFYPPWLFKNVRASNVVKSG